MKLYGLLVVLLSVAGAAGCSPAKLPVTGHLLETAGERVPGGMVSAVIYEIDGERAFTGRGMHRVTPGEHSVRVWPETHGSGCAAWGPIHLESMTVNVQAGARYHIAAIVTTEEGKPDSPQSTRTTIRPVVSRISNR